MYKEKLTMLCCSGIIGISKKWSSDLLGERKVCEIVIRAVVFTLNGVKTVNLDNE